MKGFDTDHATKHGLTQHGEILSLDLIIIYNFYQNFKLHVKNSHKTGQKFIKN